MEYRTVILYGRFTLHKASVFKGNHMRTICGLERGPLFYADVTKVADELHGVTKCKKCFWQEASENDYRHMW